MTIRKILTVLTISFSIIIFYLCFVGTSGNLEYVKNNSSNCWENQGFVVVGYEGYELGFWGFNNYGGAKVWYRLSKKTNDITYSGYLQRWGDEIHVYGPHAIDALRPDNN